jgi:protein tyrosine phosphatase type 4A
MGTEHLEQPVNVQAISRPGAPIHNSAKKQKGNGVMMANAMTIGTEPTFIEVKQMRFLVMDAPRQGNLHLYIKKLRKHHVTDIVRYCEPTYKSEELTNAGIRLHEMEFKDGTSPSKEIIMAWLQLVDKTFFQGAGDNACIAVHCVAGLGRAPQMVAIALIEFGGMDPVEAVSYIRERRRGAINEKQLLYLEGYRKQYKRAGGAEGGCCVIL